MLNFILRRLFAVVPVLVVVALFVFFMLRLIPGDPAALIAGDNATTDQIAGIREQLGLDQSIWVQFAIWVGNLLQGNLGESFFFKKTVVNLIAQRFEPTLALTICTLVIAVVVAVPVGVLAAYKQGFLIDRLCLGGFGFFCTLVRNRLLSNLRLCNRSQLVTSARLRQYKC
jgi:peptide/nickel transport system permease protein